MTKKHENKSETESKNLNVPKKSNPKSFFLLIAAALLTLGLAQWIITESPEPVPTEAAKKEKTLQNGNTQEKAATTDQEEDLVPETLSSEELSQALKARILGDTSAPLKISEHSSLTCGYCGAFHKNTFKALEENYIKTGKAYLVFSDFPLNAPALHASMIARCLPHDRYFDFLQALFEQQEQWSHDVGYMTYLKTISGTYGLSQEKFEACIKSPGLQDGILKRMKAAGAQWQVKSTPSFVLNNKTLVTGALPYEQFRKILDKEAQAREDK